MRQRTLGQICEDGRRIALDPNASVKDAAALMKEQVIGAVMVIRDGDLLGILSERDIVTRVVTDGLDPAQTRLDQVMTRHVITAPPETTAIAGLRMMREFGFRHIPVVDREHVVGLVSLRDFLGDEVAEVQDEMSFEDAVAEELW